MTAPRQWATASVVAAVAWTVATAAAEPLVGFNVKGSLDGLNQVAMVQREFRNRDNPGRLALRLQGGTRSQRVYPEEWPDALIEAWVSVQTEFGCPLVFVVNFNDTPASQRNFFQRWTDAGATHMLIELMNEPYLPKFRRAHDDPLNVEQGRIEVTPATEFMTPEKYLGMVDAFVAAFADTGLPFAAALAPEREGAAGEAFTEWNDAVLTGIQSRPGLHATVHLYRRMPSALDYDQIGRLQERLGERRLYVTEAGVVNADDLPYEDFIAAEVAVFSEILSRLRPGDLLLAQVLFTNYPRTFEASFHPQWNGLSPKGHTLLNLFGIPRKQAAFPEIPAGVPGLLVPTFAQPTR